MRSIERGEFREPEAWGGWHGELVHEELVALAGPYRMQYLAWSVFNPGPAATALVEMMPN